MVLLHLVERGQRGIVGLGEQIVPLTEQQLQVSPTYLLELGPTALHGGGSQPCEPVGFVGLRPVAEAYSAWAYGCRR